MGKQTMLEEIVVQCREYIEANLNEKLTAEMIAHNIGYSPYYLSRVFKMMTGTSLMKYVTEVKLHKASEDILAGAKILDTAIFYGFATHSAFSKCFKRRYGYPPAYLKFYQCQEKYLKGGEVMAGLKECTSRNTEELYGILAERIEGRFGRHKLVDLTRAYEYAGEVHGGEHRYSGEPYINHCLHVAIILTDLEADYNTIIAGLLHDVPKTDSSKLSKQGLDHGISDLWQTLKLYGKELDISAFDTEAALILLADRLHNMRTIEFISKERWSEKAKETITFFAPLAERINQQELKTELNARSVTYL